MARGHGKFSLSSTADLDGTNQAVILGWSLAKPPPDLVQSVLPIVTRKVVLEQSDWALEQRVNPLPPSLTYLQVLLSIWKDPN